MDPANIKEVIDEANRNAVELMMEADPVWVDIGLARDMIPGMKEEMLLHAGPPVQWEKMCGPMRGAIIGASIYEGWATNEFEAERLAASGRIPFAPNHHHNAVGPMSGIISPNMPVFVIQDRKHDHKVYSNFNEGLGKVLRYGAYSAEVIQRLSWMRDILAPTLKQTIESVKEQKNGIALKPIISQALAMGDECHNRHNAATSLLLRELTPYMLESEIDKKSLISCYNFMNQNNFTFLNLAMANAKAMCLAAQDVEYSTIVTVLSRNGTDAGMWISGLGKKWFTAPAPVPRGVWFPGFSEEDANPDIGDSSITETAGYGGFAMAAAPAIVSWVGGSTAFAVQSTKKMYEITQTKHRYFLIPFLDSQGTPTGIDIRKVVRFGIAPMVNTGIAHKLPGIGQIGAGTASFPMELFKKALKSYAERYTQ
ncbi:MAG TPA: DUF1116 domain-containing protein [Candidatus Bathyarchaeia archaeon]|nr:DUF1116 domain-containing protein [Candidatus Bathyarchaeia archaeon]